jgi:hypothetical protein
MIPTTRTRRLSVCLSCTTKAAAFLANDRCPARRTRWVRTLLTKPVPQISPPDPNAPPQSKGSVKRDPGLTLGERGIPVSPTKSSPSRLSTPLDDKAWTETVFRTLSGGAKSEYLKCMSPAILRP